VDDVTKQSIGEVLERTVESAEETVRQPEVKSLARFGFFAKGFLFIFMGALAILLVIGERTDPVGDAAGALADIAVRPYGKVLLGIFIFGALGHGFWNILEFEYDDWTEIYGFLSDPEVCKYMVFEPSDKEKTKDSSKN
jgi:hypothetical protein